MRAASALCFMKKYSLLPRLLLGARRGGQTILLPTGSKKNRISFSLLDTLDLLWVCSWRKMWLSQAPLDTYTSSKKQNIGNEDVGVAKLCASVLLQGQVPGRLARLFSVKQRRNACWSNFYLDTCWYAAVFPHLETGILNLLGEIGGLHWSTTVLVEGGRKDLQTQKDIFPGAGWEFFFFKFHFIWNGILSSWKVNEVSHRKNGYWFF